MVGSNVANTQGCDACAETCNACADMCELTFHGCISLRLEVEIQGCSKDAQLLRTAD
ncbi:four-helix bundle copper-binding protein [Marinovum sp. 2_MG-2023]|uniref:four-helix bundle copper-binding protein n=1 Tax=unclassified Marinovum TaxID=2647166 RepID=UPI0034A2C3AF